MKLDEKYSKSSKTDKTRPMKPRRQGPYSDRMPPPNAPKWALSKEPEEEGRSSAEVEAESDEPQSVTDSGNDNGPTIHDSDVSTSDDINYEDMNSDDDDDDDGEWLFNVVGIKIN